MDGKLKDERSANDWEQEDAAFEVEHEAKLKVLVQTHFKLEDATSAHFHAVGHLAGRCRSDCSPVPDTGTTLPSLERASLAYEAAWLEICDEGAEDYEWVLKRRSDGKEFVIRCDSSP